MMFFRVLVVGLVSALLLLQLHHLHQHMHATEGSLARVSHLTHECSGAASADSCIPECAASRPPPGDEIRVVDVQRAAIARMLDPAGTTERARVVPRFRGGEFIGLGVFAVEPGSAFHTLGLQNGDTVLRINDQPVFSLLLEGSELERFVGEVAGWPDFVDIEVERAGQLVRLVILLHG